MAERVSPFDDPAERATAGIFGMACFIISLAMVFFATMLAVVVIRLQDTQPWPPGGGGVLPPSLLASTIVLLVSSGTMVVADRAARIGRARTLARWMTITFALAMLFLLTQGVAWWELLAIGVGIDANLWAWSFYVLTALHALHVLGGVIPMGFVMARARRGGYSVEDHRGVTHIAMYWHFLDLAWLGLYATLWWVTGS